jgi:hypothetical protein
MLLVKPAWEFRPGVVALPAQVKPDCFRAILALVSLPSDRIDLQGISSVPYYQKDKSYSRNGN